MKINVSTVRAIFRSALDFRKVLRCYSFFYIFFPIILFESSIYRKNILDCVIVSISSDSIFWAQLKPSCSDFEHGLPCLGYVLEVESYTVPYIFSTHFDYSFAMRCHYVSSTSIVLLRQIDFAYG